MFFKRMLQNKKQYSNKKIPYFSETGTWFWKIAFLINYSGRQIIYVTGILFVVYTTTIN